MTHRALACATCLQAAVGFDFEGGSKDLEFKVADEAAARHCYRRRRLGPFAWAGFSVAFCIMVGLGLGCGLTGKNCLPDDEALLPPPSPLGIPPGGSAFVSASMVLGGYTAASFDPPAATAFMAAVTATLGVVPPSTVYVLEGSSAIAARRLLTAFMVSFVVTAPNGSTADAFATGINGLPTSAAFSETLNVSFAAAFRPVPTKVALLSPAQISAGVPAPPVYSWSPPVRRQHACAWYDVGLHVALTAWLLPRAPSRSRPTRLCRACLRARRLQARLHRRRRQVRRRHRHRRRAHRRHLHRRPARRRRLHRHCRRRRCRRWAPWAASTTARSP